jgi:hypothetical protein
MEPKNLPLFTNHHLTLTSARRNQTISIPLFVSDPFFAYFPYFEKLMAYENALLLVYPPVSFYTWSASYEGKVGD